LNLGYDYGNLFPLKNNLTAADTNGKVGTVSIIEKSSRRLVFSSKNRSIFCGEFLKKSVSNIFDPAIF
jgi:hypothetical protein